MTRLNAVLILAISLSATAMNATPEDVFNARRLSALNKSWQLYLNRNKPTLSDPEKTRIENIMALNAQAKTGDALRESAVALKRELNREIAADRNVNEAERNIEYLENQLLPNLENRAFFMGVAPVYSQPPMSGN